MIGAITAGLLGGQYVAPTPPTPPVSGYKLWLDAADTTKITQSLNAVSQWTDKSANAYTFTQSTGSAKPTTGVATQNGWNVLSLDGFDSLISTAANSTWTFLSNNTTFTAFFAFSTNNSGFQTIINTNEDQSQYIGMDFVVNSASAYSVSHDVNNGNTGNASVSNPTATNSINTAFTYVTLLSDASNATAANRSDIRIKQGSAIKNNTRTTAVNTGTPSYPLTIGMPTNLANYGLAGTLGEILIYTSTLSAGDVLSTQQYLASKWGV